jgi:photosystem II stability/assembly factor-like uncharacterized protein
MTRSFGTVAAIAIGVAIAFTPSVAAGAVPYAGWYWSLSVPTSNPNVLLLGTSKGVYRSSNAGKSWKPAGLTDVDTTSLVQAGNAIFAGGARIGTNAKPVLVKNGAYSVTPGPAVIAVSTNAGASWRELHPLGLPNVGVQALAVDPSDSRVIDAVLRTGAIYRTTDSAHSFRRISLKAGGTPWALAITQNNQLVAGDMTTGAYLGASPQQWQRTAFADSQGSHMVMEYAVQPADLNRILMTSYGIEMSTDGGQSWHVVLKSKVMFGPIAWAPKSPDLAYAVGWDHSVWRSADGGKTWKHIA